jgi:hypothetical protein
MELTLEEARQEWEAIQGDKLSFIEWLRWNGLDIDGSRYEYKA